MFIPCLHIPEILPLKVIGNSLCVLNPGKHGTWCGYCSAVGLSCSQHVIWLNQQRLIPLLRLPLVQTEFLHVFQQEYLSVLLQKLSAHTETYNMSIRTLNVFGAAVNKYCISGHLSCFRVLQLSPEGHPEIHLPIKRRRKVKRRAKGRWTLFKTKQPDSRTNDSIRDLLLRIRQRWILCQKEKIE